MDLNLVGIPTSLLQMLKIILQFVAAVSLQPTNEARYRDKENFCQILNDNNRSSFEVENTLFPIIYPLTYVLSKITFVSKFI
jgi:hypothetical protein